MFRLGSVLMADCAFSQTRFGPHFHEEYSIAVMLGGGLRLDYGNRVCLAAPGQIVVCNPYEVHAGASVAGGWAYRIFYVPSSYVTGLIEKDAEDRGAKIAAPLIEDRELALALLHAHLIAQQKPVKLEADCAIAGAIGAMFTRHSNHDADSTEERALNHPAVARAVDYIHAEYATNIGLDCLADVAHLSPYHFLRTFSRQTGLTPHAYLVQVRVQAAAALLRQGRSPLEAACETGFADVSHLNRTFKRTLGVPPGVFGRACRASRVM